MFLSLIFSLIFSFSANALSETAIAFTRANEILMCLPDDRTKLGVLFWGGQKDNFCYVKALGEKNEKHTDGHTPSGIYTIRALRGNSSGQWGGKGLQLRPMREHLDVGSRYSDSIFIHAHEDHWNSVQKAKSKGCPIVSGQCMAELRNYYLQSLQHKDLIIYVYIEDPQSKTKRCQMRRKNEKTSPKRSPRSWLAR